MNLDDIKALIELLNNSDLTELEFESEEVKIRLKKGSFQSPPVANISLNSHSSKSSLSELTTNQIVPTPQVSSVSETSTPPALTPVPTIKPSEIPTEEAKRKFVVRSPMVGTFYGAPAPGAEPFVHVGKVIRKGQVLCVIEAMKLMNEIEAEVAGRIERILVENAQPIEYGEPIFEIEIL